MCSCGCAKLNRWGQQTVRAHQPPAGQPSRNPRETLVAPPSGYTRGKNETARRRLSLWPGLAYWVELLCSTAGLFKGAFMHFVVGHQVKHEPHTNTQCLQSCSHASTLVASIVVVVFHVCL